MDRDNHAGKMIELGWIAGFFDGEGYIGLYRRSDRKKPEYNIVYRASVVISNTDKPSIDELSKRLDSFGVPHYVKVQKRETKKWRTNWCVAITGYKRISKFLEIIGPYCVTKKDQIEEMQRFIKRRSSVSKNTPYREEDHNTYEKLKKIKRVEYPKAIKSSETTR